MRSKGHIDQGLFYKWFYSEALVFDGFAVKKVTTIGGSCDMVCFDCPNVESGHGTIAIGATVDSYQLQSFDLVPFT